MFELSTDDSLGGQAETIAVEANRSLDIVDADREYFDVWFHHSTPASPEPHFLRS
jgi:hypothetical protein